MAMVSHDDSQEQTANDKAATAARRNAERGIEPQRHGGTEDLQESKKILCVSVPPWLRRCPMQREGHDGLAAFARSSARLLPRPRLRLRRELASRRRQSVRRWRRDSRARRRPSRSSERTGGPKTRHVIGRAAYKSHSPVAGSSAGHGSSLAKSSKRSAGIVFVAEQAGLAVSPGKSADNRAADSSARRRTSRARAGSACSNSRRPSCSRRTSSWLMAKTPMQHWVHPGLQTSQSPLRRAASASAASTI